MRRDAIAIPPRTNVWARLTAAVAVEYAIEYHVTSNAQLPAVSRMVLFTSENWFRGQYAPMNVNEEQYSHASWGLSSPAAWDPSSKPQHTNASCIFRHSSGYVSIQFFINTIHGLDVSVMLRFVKKLESAFVEERVESKKESTGRWER